ncbi:hypothetical protein [Methanocorpusculum vombati]|uniref:Uncharacterized protein n=1 Tax=Methanocorpusculum vombati TaxID=3002864 RepID=A0ABT4IKI7_9EURY|nr:hypothetical protein [Methanocorpusculum vombati]MCZ9319569.1 hypothetical protein [Methanocorpusculum sp.]MCZ0862258.1 hypothetical protein [Methanocorpusculum vombati]MDE2519738.1 hypothetical protein [Methanocorpusculum sp.]MDE2534482.1 hypothetical protein [Methanocorpusculum sp.]MDE2545199.1 hypothetical protein [Methanocorpusculum sp.]
MYNTLTTSVNTITLIKPMISIRRNTIIDTVHLLFSMTIKNNGSASVTLTPQEILSAIREVKVTSNNNISNYAMNGLDLAIMNCLHETKSRSVIKSIGSKTIAASASETVEFSLILNEGDLLAVLKQDVTLEIGFNDTVKAGTTSTNGVNLTAATVTVTTGDRVIESKDEITNEYGSSAERSAEPKVYILSTAVGANTALTEALAIPTGTLIRRAIICCYATGATSPEITPDAIGLIATNPNRQEIMNVSAKQLRATQNKDYFVDCSSTERPAGIFMIDFANEVAADGLGLKGWRFGVDDFKIAAKTSTAFTMRVIFVENVVNTAAFDAGTVPILETPLGF